MPPITLTWEEYVESDAEQLVAHCKPASLRDPHGWLLPGRWPELTARATDSLLADLYGQAERKARFLVAVTIGVEDGEDHRQ